MKKTGLFLGFFAALVLLFWILLSKYSTALEKKITTISNVKKFSFVNYNGDTINNKTVKNKVYLAEFFFSTCTGICPLMNKYLNNIVYSKFKNDSNFCILSHTVTPQIDDKERLKKYADSIGVNTSNWYFLTGTKALIYEAARTSYTVDDPKNNLDDTTLLHTQYVALVDKQQRVRAIYDATKKVELEECTKKIQELLKE